MTKTLQQIQEENRRAVIMACNPLSKMPAHVWEKCKDNPEKYIASMHSEIDAILKLGDSDYFKYVCI